jgi:hypothetical protein
MTHRIVNVEETTMKRRLVLLALCAAVGALPFTQVASQEPLPAAMSGRWIGMGGQGAKAGGKMPIDFAWSVKVTKQNPDGSIEGTITYGGPQCSAKDAPMTGKFDGTELRMTVQLEPKVQCGVQNFRMQKAGGKHLFEGKGQNRTGYLDPS